MTDNKKDFIINLRVPRKLYETIKSKAHENRETISSLARKLFEDGCEIFSDLTNEIFPGKKEESVYSYEVKAEGSLACSKCKKKIKKGEKVKIYETQNGKKIINCLKCKMKR